MSINAWAAAKERILDLLRLEPDWNGDGAPAICPSMIRSALHLADTLELEQCSAPHIIYSLPDGNISLEWQHPDGIIERIEIEGIGHGELMVTYPDRPTEFSKKIWPPAGVASKRRTLSGRADQPSSLFAVVPRLDEDGDPTGCDFQLAA